MYHVAAIFSKMFKIKAIATLYVEKNEQGEAEETKTIKLQVPRGTTVRDFVTKALKKADLGSSFGCVGVQYSSKKFDKFLDVGYDEIIKDGREYTVKVNWSLLAIKKIDDKSDGEVAAVSKKGDDDLSTCKSHADDDGNTLSCSTASATEKLDETSEHHATYAEVVKMGAESKDIEVPKEEDLAQAEKFKEDVEAPEEEQNVSKVTFSEQALSSTRASRTHRIVRRLEKLLPRCRHRLRRQLELSKRDGSAMSFLPLLSKELGSIRWPASPFAMNFSSVMCLVITDKSSFFLVNSYRFYENVFVRFVS
uniref:Uncharacterized protein n=1 Tax=Ditylenchus dipsaci TaxID=166011 RepID=A0A915CUA8_9BILA